MRAESAFGEAIANGDSEALNKDRPVVVLGFIRFIGLIGFIGFMGFIGFIG